jgi:hypothetical protein
MHMAGPVTENPGPGDARATDRAAATGPASGRVAADEPPAAGHDIDEIAPGADAVIGAAVLTEVDRPVAGLSRWIAGAHAVAAQTGRTLYVITGHGARVTYPLELLLVTSPAARWIVRSARGQFQDGLSGQPLRWDGQRFTAAERDAPPAAPPAQPDGQGSVRIDITRLHPAAGDVDIGGTASAAAAALTGADPAGWGTGEPVTEPWSSPELTAFARERAPRPTSVVVTAGAQARPAAGLLEAEPGAGGVLTRLRLAVGAASYPGPWLHAALDGLAGMLAAEDAHAMLASWQPGPADATREPGRQPPSVPVGLFAGREIVAVRGVKHAQAAPAETTAIVGSGARRACWCRFGTEAPHQALVDVTDHFRKW